MMDKEILTNQRVQGLPWLMDCVAIFRSAQTEAETEKVIVRKWYLRKGSK